MAGRMFVGFRQRVEKVNSSIKKIIRKRPFVSFYVAILVFVAIIVLSSKLQTTPKTVTPKSPPKQVSLYYIGSVPKITVSAQIEKTGVVKVVALSGGVLQKINYHEGDSVVKGNTLFNLSTNYQGGNAMSVQRELANNQYQSALDTFDLQNSIIQGQRDIATKSAENSDKLRDVTTTSRDETQQMIDLDNSILDNVNTNLNGLENGSIIPTGSSTPDIAIATLQSQKLQLLAGLAQARSSLASMNYQSDTDRPPQQLAVMQVDLTQKQLDLQEKMLSVNKIEKTQDTWISIGDAVAEIIKKAPDRRTLRP